MNKYIGLLGLLIIGLSFAAGAPVNPLLWKNYVDTCCQYRAVDAMLMYAYGNYNLYENACTPGFSGFMSESLRIGMIMFGGFVPNGLDNYYYAMQDACRGGSSQECSSAMQDFNSRAASARAEFNSAKMYYYAKAAQAVRDNKVYGKDCSTTRATTLPVPQIAREAYNRCEGDPEDACFRVS